MAESRELSLILSLKDEASKSLKGFKKNVADGLADIGKGMTVAGGAITAFMGLAIKSGVEAEASWAKVSKQVELGGLSIQDTIPKIQDFASALLLATGADDEFIGELVGRAIPVTKDLAEAEKLASLALDIQAGTGRDATSVMTGLALASQGNIDQLKRFVPELKMADGDMLKMMSSSERASFALEAVQKQFGGLAQIDTAEKNFKVFAETMSNLRDRIGTALIPALTDLVKSITGVIVKVEAWSKAHPELFDKLVKVIAVVGAVMVVLGPLLVMLPGIVTAVGLLSGAFAWLGTVLTATAITIGAVAIPVWAIILAIGALIAVGYLLITHWDQVKAYASSVWESVYSTISGVITRVRDFVVGVLTSIRDFFAGIWNGILNVINTVFGAIATAIKYWLAFSFGLIILFLDTFLPGWQEKLQAIYQTAVEVFTAIGNFFVATWQWIQMAWQSGVDFISNLWTTVWTAISNFIMPIVGAVQEKISAMWLFLKDLFTKASKPLTDAWNTLWDGIKGVASSAWEGIKDVVKSGINWIIDKLNWFIQKANEVASKGAGALGITVPNISQIPRLAKGGIVTSPTFAQIGEAGPEAVIPLNKMGSFGGVTINITGGTFVGTTMKELAESLGDIIMDKLRLNGKLAI